ncbi:MAG: chromosomal replication initiator protein DnaA [Chloroflexi bacterium]|nr:chromosomal replication initiator protein DnaA [Chloroflexota bacterium]
MNAKQIWQAVLGELQLQVSKANYETWLKNTSVVSHEDGLFIIGAPNSFAKEWLESRFLSKIKRTLTSIIGQTVDLKIVVAQPKPRTRSLQSSLLPQEEVAPTLVLEQDEVPPPRHSSRTKRDSLPLPEPPPQDGGWTPNPDYTFSEFIIGKCNSLAHAACIKVANHPARAYNPLFIYGGVGLGKTHLLHAIAHVTLPKGLRVVYVTSEQFTNDLITAIRERSTDDFRRQYRRADVLLIDDIQFIAGKESTQEEFFHTFNALREANKQVVISSDRPPKLLATLEERLRSRFEWGLITDIQPPDFETRMAFLQSKAQKQQISISSEVLQFIANRPQHNYRELEGTLNRIIAYSLLHKRALTIKVASEALHDLTVSPKHGIIQPEQIIKAVAEYYQIEPRALRGKGRSKEIVLPRQVAMYLMREETSCSLLEIGRELGGRDHSTVLHSHEKVRREIEIDTQLRKDVLSIRERLYAHSQRR